MSNTINLLKKLIQQQSVTPDETDCLTILGELLKKLDFDIEYLRFDDVNNLWARRGTTEPLLVFAGHTDVVPTGPKSNWTFPPFEPTEHEGMLYGRGTADMKGSIAAMCTAVERFIAENPSHEGSIAFLITGDEEGPSINGTVKVIDELVKRKEQIDYCLVGEPSSTSKLADIIKNGRRGSLNGHLHIKGKQGHVAYPHLADNPIHLAIPFLSDLCGIVWDNGNEYFPATTFQISNIESGTGAENVIPGELKVMFNFRYSTEVTAKQIKSKVTNLIKKHQLDHDITWRLSGKPFITPKGELVSAVSAAIKQHCNYDTELSTTGGTSDGRFIAPTGAQVVELGPINKTIHQIDECVSIEDLKKLSLIYESMLVNIFKTNTH
ncbi:N-succinyl-L,L-diaminopimelate desuccinylase [hydrothermal vent metagenome]|uniref:Succinyl-diaminopimelate desuccinylase n=1 Tax=hydrothermal vent metagenome TaxID=652676 RepID=A0A3B0ZIB8_9ZZZZ